MVFVRKESGVLLLFTSALAQLGCLFLEGGKGRSGQEPCQPARLELKKFMLKSR